MSVHERARALAEWVMADLDCPDVFGHRDELIASLERHIDPLDFLDGAREEYQQELEVRRLLGYLWTATGKNHLRPVSDLFAEDDPLVADVERLAIMPEVPA